MPAAATAHGDPHKCVQYALSFGCNAMSPRSAYIDVPPAFALSAMPPLPSRISNSTATDTTAAQKLWQDEMRRHTYGHVCNSLFYTGSFQPSSPKKVESGSVKKLYTIQKLYHARGGRVDAVTRSN